MPWRTLALRWTHMWPQPASVAPRLDQNKKKKKKKGGFGFDRERRRASESAQTQAGAHTHRDEAAKPLAVCHYTLRAWMLTTRRLRAPMLTTPETHQPSLEARVSFVASHCPQGWWVQRTSMSARANTDGQTSRTIQKCRRLNRCGSFLLRTAWGSARPDVPSDIWIKHTDTTGHHSGMDHVTTRYQRCSQKSPKRLSNRQGRYRISGFSLTSLNFYFQLVSPSVESCNQSDTAHSEWILFYFGLH